MERERGIDRYYRQVREIRDELGVSHDEARRRWGEFYAPGGTPIKPVKKAKRGAAARAKLVVRASVSSAKNCPYCRDEITAGSDADYTCTACKTHYHLDCFQQELDGSCVTLGCTARRVVRRARVAFTMPTTPAPGPTYVVRQEGRDPVIFMREEDAYRFASQIIEPGRDVHVTTGSDEQPTTAQSDEERMEEEALHALEDLRRRPRSNVSVFFDFLEDMFGPLVVPSLIVGLAVIVVLIAVWML